MGLVRWLSGVEGPSQEVDLLSRRAKTTHWKKIGSPCPSAHSLKKDTAYRPRGRSLGQFDSEMLLRIVPLDLIAVVGGAEEEVVDAVATVDDGFAFLLGNGEVLVVKV